MNTIINIILIVLLALAMFLLKKKSKKTKKFAFFLSILFFIILMISPYIKSVYNNRPRHLSVPTSDIYSMDLEKDYYTIKQIMNITILTKISDFEVNFEKNGSIKSMKYAFITETSQGYELYKVNYDVNKKRYEIKKHKEKEFPQYNEQADEVIFFKYLSCLNLKKIIKKDYPYYTLSCSGQYISWEIKEWENYKISSGGVIKKIRNEDLPIKGYAFFFHGNKKTSLGGYLRDNNKAYLFY